MTFFLTSGLTSLAPEKKALTRRLTSGNAHRRDGADDVRLGHLAGDHAGEIGRLVDPVVEDAEIRLGRPGAGAEQEGDLRELLGGAARLALGGEGVAQHQLVAAAGIFAHDAAEIGGLHLLRPFVLDAELLLGLLQRDMDLVDPRAPRSAWRRSPRPSASCPARTPCAAARRRRAPAAELDDIAAGMAAPVPVRHDLCPLVEAWSGSVLTRCDACRASVAGQGEFVQTVKIGGVVGQAPYILSAGGRNSDRARLFGLNQRWRSSS